MRGLPVTAMWLRSRLRSTVHAMYPDNPDAQCFKASRNLLKWFCKRFIISKASGRRRTASNLGMSSLYCHVHCRVSDATVHVCSFFSAVARFPKVRDWMARLHKLKMSLPHDGQPVDPEHGRFTPDVILNMDQVYMCLISILRHATATLCRAFVGEVLHLSVSIVRFFLLTRCLRTALVVSAAVLCYERDV